MATVRFTVLANDDDEPVGKVVELVNGDPKTTSSHNAHPTSFEVVESAGPVEVMEVLRGLGPSRCITAGVPANGSRRGRITTKNSPRPGALTTSRVDWVFPDGPGLMLLDYDPKTPAEGFPERLRLTPQDWAAAVSSVAPGLLASCVYAPSSSSCIHRPGEEPEAPKGFHHYGVVADARDVPRAGRALFDRLVLAGYGYGAVRGDGRVEVKSIVDECVWTPSRLIYTGGAKCGPGLLQSRAFKARGVSPVDTMAGEEVAHAA